MTQQKPKAPRPGVGKRKAAAAESRKTLTMTLLGESLTLAYQSIPLGEKMEVRNQTGRPYVYWLSPIGEETYAIWWWLARRANGEPDLRWTAVRDAWPTDLDLSDNSEDLVLSVQEAAGDDPEA